MGKLAGFRVRRLKLLGFEFCRQAGGSDEIWRNPSMLRYTTVPNHPGDMPEGTLRAILEQAGVSPEEFLASR
jgi:predicted RNA binding protein YcfA (HicA-like mRNA interferase family)